MVLVNIKFTLSIQTESSALNCNSFFSVYLAILYAVFRTYGISVRDTAKELQEIPSNRKHYLFRSIRRKSKISIFPIRRKYKNKKPKKVFWQSFLLDGKVPYYFRQKVKTVFSRKKMFPFKRKNILDISYWMIFSKSFLLDGISCNALYRNFKYLLNRRWLLPRPYRARPTFEGHDRKCILLPVTKGACKLSD